MLRSAPINGKLAQTVIFFQNVQPRSQQIFLKNTSFLKKICYNIYSMFIKGAFISHDKYLSLRLLKSCCIGFRYDYKAV